MRESIIRGVISLIAALVTLARATEWSTWALERRQYWRFIPAGILAGFSIFESHQAWKRVDRYLIRLGETSHA